MQRIHESICDEHKGQLPTVQLSLDGVMESNSSFNSLDVYSIKYNHCRNVYPVRIIKPCDRYKYEEQEQLRKVLKDLNENNIIIDCCVFDNPKRSMAKCVKCHSARFPCEYCESCAFSHVETKKRKKTEIMKKFDLEERRLSQRIHELQETQDASETETEELLNLREALNTLTQDRDKEIKKQGRTQLKWPANTMTGKLRTLESINVIVEKIEENPNILKTDPDYCKGIKGRSPLMNHPHFHMINDAPCEYMHCVCLGMVKRLVSLTFKVGEVRERVTIRKLTPPEQYNVKIKSVQLPRESSRRCRNLDYGVLKASEFRNILIFFFPIVLECIGEEFKSEQELWLHFVFQVRACILPNDEFKIVNSSHVQSAGKKFYIMYEQLYGVTNCTYSIHVGASHLLKIRGSRPLTFKSAFKFESYFAEMKQLFHAGTVSPLKQIIQNCFVKRILETHHCEKTLFFAPPKENAKENNYLVYIFDENEKICMYSINKILDDDNLQCHTQGKYQFQSNLTPEYDWSTVGVFRAGPISEDNVIIKKKAISGKVLKVSNLLITCPINVLLEQ